MWSSPEQDPGGNKGLAPSSQELSDLKDQNEQQLVLIAQLKEMLRKEQSSVTQEKVEEYVNSLSKAKAKKSRAKKDDSSSSGQSVSTANIDSSKKERINLLRQQLEENKAKLAERGKSQKGIEDMVTQLQAQFNDSQQLISLTTPLNLSLAESKNIEYSKSSSQDELYNILLIKEKKITELIHRTQKLEGNVLDLQENLKEKDSVLDARTKAITLMTDSLSKKSKNTVDALEETKEQMRKMQENFVTLESEMKSRQVLLLNDLKTKKFEISDLQEENSKLKDKLEHGNTEKSDSLENEKLVSRIAELEKLLEKDNDQLIKELQKKLEEANEENRKQLETITDLEKQLEETTSDLNRLKNTGVAIDTTDNEEISKLKKQLDESNKNMIKVKAQHKSKIKELNKKIDAFKKTSDANALIVQLQTENSKLNERIAELEDEKGNLQLKMVESTSSSKDSSKIEEDIQELQENLSKQLSELDEKDKIISLLESEILSLKEVINMKVTSEMTSIDYEEQLEKNKELTKKLNEEKEELLRERGELLENIETLKREKQELNTKLENYLQENMELIDKLEKLSAEKVSSAESIEIVEGLTQQEKLELAAYQKHVNPEAELKSTDEDQLEAPAELNESVLQLSEDTAELLQKIDMFTQERKEVMTKMEALKEENNILSIKLKETENNRDVLAETYEQLQNEKEELLEKLKNAETKEETVEPIKASPGEDFSSKLRDLQSEHEALLKEKEELKRTLKEHDSKIHEKNNLEIELKAAREKITDLEASIKSNLEEINNYQAVIEENKNELINSSTVINDLQNKLLERETDIKDLNTIISDLNNVISNLEAENKKIDSLQNMETELDSVKQILKGYLEQNDEHESELEQNSETIKNLNLELVEMNRRILENENELEVKDNKISNMQKEVENKDTVIKNLQNAIKDKDEQFKTVSENLRDKYLALQKQLDGNSDSLQKKVEELTTKNKEQLEKMKKIAANLKKKSQAYQELEEHYNEAKEKWENEAKEKDQKSDEKVFSILDQLKELENEITVKTTKLDESERNINILTDKLQSLEQNNVDLQHTILELRRKEEKLNEVSLQQELSTSLHEEFDSHNASADLVHQEKIHELEMVIETNEADMEHYKERLNKLEEDLRKLEEEKAMLEMRNFELEEKLNLTSNSFKEKSMLEDQLELKLAEISGNDEILNKKLQESTEQNQELVKKNQENEELIKKLKIKLKKSQDRVNELKSLENNYEELENLNTDLKKQVLILETNQKQIQNENESLQRQNMSDYEKIEADYQIQLEDLLKTKNELTVECEKLQEKLRQNQEKEEDLLMELSEYKIKLEQSEDIKNEEIRQLNEELKVSRQNLHEVDQLKQQVADLQNELLRKTATVTVDTIIEEASESVKRKVPPEQAINEDNIISESSQQSLPTFHWPEAQNTQNIELFSNPIPPQTNIDCFNTQQTFNNLFAPVEQPQVQDNVSSSYVPNQQVSGASGIFDPFSQKQPQDTVSNSFVQSEQPQMQAFNSSLFAPVQQQQHQAGSSLFDPNLQQQNIHLVENSREELINKIKALEFLLYNVDKEKEIALSECTDMINELTRMVYQKVTYPQTESMTTASDLESQIVSELDIVDAVANKKVLQNMEYEKVDPCRGEQNVSVTEDVLQPKQAYLCYSDDEKTENLQKQNVNSSLVSQIVSESDINAASNKKLLQDIEFVKVKPSQGEHKLPVSEDLEQPKQAYLCYTKEERAGKQHAALEAFEENDDGWGWGPEEAKLEEEHINKIGNTPQIQSLRSEMEQLKENVCVLQKERENHLEEIKQLQVKSGKLIKKCKELKLKNDQLSKKGDGNNFFDLNETIQEELKTQVQQLEKKMKDIFMELEKDRAEKSGLLKRIDVLTAANERMLEMKEIQDTEVMRWQRKHQEAVEKLQQYEWGNDGFGEDQDQKPEKPVESAKSKPDSKKIEELEKTINELTLDNDELQALLDEQRKLRIEAEKSKSPPKTSATEEEYSNILKAKEALNIKVLQLEDQINELKSAKVEKESVVEEIKALRALIQEKESTINELQESVQQLTRVNSEVNNVLAEKVLIINEFQENVTANKEELTSKIIELENHISALNDQNSEHKKYLDGRESIINALQSDYEQLKNKKIELENEIKDLNLKINNEEQQIPQLQFDNAQNQQFKELAAMEQFKEQIRKLKMSLQEKENNIQELTFVLGQINNENAIYQDLNNQQQKSLEERDVAINALQCDFDQLNNRRIELETQIKDLNQKQNNEEQQIVQLQHDNSQNQQIQNFSVMEQLKEQIQMLQITIQEKENKIQELQVSLEQVSNEKALIKNDLKQLTEELNKNRQDIAQKESEIQELTKNIQNKDLQFESILSQRTAELSETWQSQVDQRGMDVAESWKMHLETVELDFASVQFKLKEEMAELEEKCNALVNENNELRKNVDAEIRNEVDRVTALQQQIANSQGVISELNNTLQKKQLEYEDLIGRVPALENELTLLKAELAEKDTKLSSVNVIIETTQKQFDEKREVVEEIVRILEKNTSWPLSYEKEDVLKEFQRQLNVGAEKQQEIAQLSQTLEDYQSRLNVVSEKDQEISRLNNALEILQSQYSLFLEKDQEILRLNSIVEQFQVTQQELQIIQQEHANCSIVLDDYTQKLDEFKITHIALQQSLEEKNQLIATLNEKLQLSESCKNDNNKDIEQLNNEIAQAKQDCIILQQSLSECQTQLFNVNQQLTERTNQFEVVNEQLNYSQQNYNLQQEELNKLRQFLQEKEADYSSLLETCKQNHYEELLSAKDLDNERVKAQLNELMKHSQETDDKLALEVNLKQQLEEKVKALEAKLLEQAELLEEENSQLSELRTIIEQQVLKIEELKKELFEKSSQYDSIIAEMDIGRQAVTQQPLSSPNPPSFGAPTKDTQASEDDLSEPVNRAELDLALYMLHQRDVRCEELTVELTQLLEERDTLQLRLSNAIREKEELRRKGTVSGEEVVNSSGSSPVNLTPHSKSSAIFLAASGTELATEPEEFSLADQSLATKLSELKSVGYKRDKTFVDEQDMRRMQQLSIMQQHINEASKLPPEAAARLVDASYTLSRDVQSPSKVLLNWLWGKSTPKVNDT